LKNYINDDSHEIDKNMLLALLDYRRSESICVVDTRHEESEIYLPSIKGYYNNITTIQDANSDINQWNKCSDGCHYKNPLILNKADEVIISNVPCKFYGMYYSEAQANNIRAKCNIVFQYNVTKLLFEINISNHPEFLHQLKTIILNKKPAKHINLVSTKN
jgi:hypothetical protein